MICSWTFGAALIGMSFYGLFRLVSVLPNGLDIGHVLIVAGPPVVITALFIGEVVYVALTHRNKWSDAEREVLARAAGHHFLSAAAWLILFGLVIFGPLIVFDFQRNLSLDPKGGIAALAGAGGLAGLVTALLGWAKTTTATIREQITSWKDIPRNTLMALATAIFVVSLIVVTSTVVIDWGVQRRPETSAGNRGHQTSVDLAMGRLEARRATFHDIDCGRLAGGRGRSVHRRPVTGAARLPAKGCGDHPNVF